MEEICPKCGLPKELCVCEEIAKETQKIKIRTDRARFGKVVTIIEGLDSSIDGEQLAKDLKKTLACGGTFKEGKLILQGDHKTRVKELLIKKGFKEDQIDVI